jgi:hypothetical protein
VSCEGATSRLLGPLIGRWSMQASFPGAPASDLRGLTVFEWVAGETLLLQRWDVPHPDAPDGVAIIGFDAGTGTYRQHYFDSRGVARVYEMSFTSDVWKLTRTAPDLSPLDFSQRFTGTFSADHNTIEGEWETSEDGSRWQHDFDLTYTRLTGSQASG